ncbi:hypothetical protein F5880DRAFT_1104170 [Lentinula raphanica]|nr:hypothetical protein F5880DRAFT_1104170 [Lentinula raphanica]
MNSKWKHRQMTPVHRKSPLVQPNPPTQFMIHNRFRVCIYLLLSMCLRSTLCATGRQRAPLPPQSARFREVSRNHPASSAGGIHEAVLQEQPQTQLSPPVIRSQPLTLERDRPPHQRSSKFGPPLTNDSTPSSASRDRSPSVRYPQPGQGSSDPADGSSSRAHINGNTAHAIQPIPNGYTDRDHAEDTMNGQLPKAPRAMGRDDTAPTAPRASTVRERSPRGPDRETRELGLAHHPERTWKDELMASQVRIFQTLYCKESLSISVLIHYSSRYGVEDREDDHHRIFPEPIMYPWAVASVLMVYRMGLLGHQTMPLVYL